MYHQRHSIWNAHRDRPLTQTWITVRALEGRLVTELLLLLLYDDHCNSSYLSGQHTDISSILGLWFTSELYGNMQPQIFWRLLVSRTQTLRITHRNKHSQSHMHTADAHTHTHWSYSALLSHTLRFLTLVLFPEVVYSINLFFFPKWPVSVAHCWCCFRLKTKHRGKKIC